MKKILIFFIIICSWALTSKADPATRKGFFLDTGLGVGGETIFLPDFGGQVDIRLGFGITERTSIFLENSFQYTFRNFLGLGFSAYGAQLKVQQFLTKGLYVNIGGGLSIGSVHLAHIPITSSVGFSISGGVGYEFRLGKRFRLGPEFDLYYHRIGGANFLVPMASLRLKAYF